MYLKNADAKYFLHVQQCHHEGRTELLIPNFHRNKTQALICPAKESINLPGKGKHSCLLLFIVM
jgi:hypothetical protein